MSTDPVDTNPDSYRVVFENERVRVLEYTDEPGHRSEPHSHPDSVMVTLSAFRRRLSRGDTSFETELPVGAAMWLPAQSHWGENIGETGTRAIFVELLEPAGEAPDGPEPLGPARG